MSLEEVDKKGKISKVIYSGYMDMKTNNLQHVLIIFANSYF